MNNEQNLSLGEQNMTKEQQPAPAPVPIVRKKKQKPPSRGERFTDAAQTLMDAIGDLRLAWEENMEAINNALEELRGVQEEYEDWLNNLPENLQSSALGEKLQTLVAISLDDIDEPDFDSLEGAAQECLDADIPLGFGRD
jgi:hypothetical protein